MQLNTVKYAQTKNCKNILFKKYSVYLNFSELDLNLSPGGTQKYELIFRVRRLKSLGTPALRGKMCFKRNLTRWKCQSSYMLILQSSLLQCQNYMLYILHMLHILYMLSHLRLRVFISWTSIIYINENTKFLLKSLNSEIF